MNFFSLRKVFCLSVFCIHRKGSSMKRPLDPEDLAVRQRYLLELAQDPDLEASKCIERQRVLRVFWPLTVTPLAAIVDWDDNGCATSVSIPCSDNCTETGDNACWHKAYTLGPWGEHAYVIASYALWNVYFISICRNRLVWWNKEGRHYEARKWRQTYTFFLRGVTVLLPALPALREHFRKVGTTLTWPSYIVLRDPESFK